MKAALFLLIATLALSLAVFALFARSATPRPWPIPDGTLKVEKVEIAGRKYVMVGGEIGHYYYIPADGDVRYLGSLRESWYEDEARVRFRMRKLIPIEVLKR
jgi:hypothetical protein